jgi:hypothetical protein
MLVGREAAQGLQPTGMIVGVHEQLEVSSALFVGLVVVTLDRGVLDGAVHPFNLPVIRYVPVRCLLVRLFSSEDAIMVSPSGTRGTGSTKVRAGRR